MQCRALAASVATGSQPGPAGVTGRSHPETSDPESETAWVAEGIKVATGCNDAAQPKRITRFPHHHTVYLFGMKTG